MSRRTAREFETVMRPRFGRRRWRSDDGRGAAIDESWLQRAAAVLPIASLTRRNFEDIPDSFALTATGAAEGGEEWLVAVSPRAGGDAALALAVAAVETASDTPRVLAAASPSWDAPSRRILAALEGLPGPIRAIALSAEAVAAALPADAPISVVPEARLVEQLANPASRDLFARTALSLRALAAKHGGATRVAGAGLELVVLAKGVAWLRCDGERVLLDLLDPERASLTISDALLSDALDRLEGNLRRRLGDRRVREGEEGLRARWIPLLGAAAGLRGVRAWPLGGGAAEGIDLVGVTADGAPTVGAVREKLGIAQLAEILRASFAIEPSLALLTQDAGPPVRLTDRPRLALAAAEIDGSIQRALASLALRVSLFRGAGDAPLTALDIAAASPATAAASAAFVPAPSAPPPRAILPERAPLPPPIDELRDPVDERYLRDGGAGAGNGGAGPSDGDVPVRRRRGRRRRGRGGERGFEANESAANAGPDEETEELGGENAIDEPAPRPEPRPQAGGFEQMSVFDLDEESGAQEAPAGNGRGRKRGRGRRRRGGRGDGGEDEVGEGDAGGAEPAAAAPPRPRAEAAADDAADDLEELAELSPDAPEIEEREVPAYEEEEESEPETELDRVRLERERRRLARARDTGAEAATTSGADSGVVSEEMLPRGRAALLVHADRESLVAAVLLAREMRGVEGIWVYPQSELMTFFRGVSTDLRENTPIYVIGFAARPIRDALQAAALYRGRIVWLDHHDWPPEDLGAMRSAIGDALTRVRPGTHSSLPAVVAQLARRSRFSDKLVDLVTGRFTPHDFQHWGRVWWWRLGELSQRVGERRADLDLLIAGRPSELTREAGRIQTPPPPELAWVSERDFRLLHFGGLSLAVAEVPESLDLHMALRLLRERYDSALAVGWHAGHDVFVLGCDDASGRRNVDAAGMAEHLAEKFSWVELLPDEDHVARVRIRDLALHPDRADELVAEIGMGRSILEG